MGKLDGLKCYLAGPPVVPGQWHFRDAITPRLKEFGVIPIDPMRKPIRIELDDGVARGERHRWKADGDWESFGAIMTLIRDIDLKLVARSDFLIAFLDTTIPLCGTYEEMLLANSLRMPTLVWCPKRRVLDWVFGAIDHNFMFDDMGALMGYLAGLDELPASVDYQGRWLFMGGK